VFFKESHTSKPYIHRGTQVNNDREFNENPQRFISARPGYGSGASFIYSINNYLKLNVGVCYSTYSTRVTYLGISPPPVSKIFLTVINTVKYSYISLPIRFIGLLPINKIFSFTGSLNWSYCRMVKSYYDLYNYDYSLPPPNRDYGDWTKNEPKYNKLLGFGLGGLVKLNSKFKLSFTYHKSYFKGYNYWLQSTPLKSSGASIGLEYGFTRKQKK